MSKSYNSRVEKIREQSAYTVLESTYIADLDSQGLILRHNRTGARVVLLVNDDDNKVFYIGFRTPPADSTGVAHIIEHSVLCGSERYPVKDPFIELAKGSLNTFLNAMTYSDKTVYPVASCNDQDFKNLMDVYMDAVLHPNIYHEEKIFKQEGWHYEIEGPDEELRISGVVYNEMKGAFSSPDDVVEREMFNALFPDNPYGVESGGDPLNIPDLTYEMFLDFHSRYYHPSNSYIYIYGDCDMAERLEYLDREYLSHYDALDIDSSVSKQNSFDEPRYLVKEYPISENESEKEHTYLTYSVVTAEDNLDKEEYIAFEALDYALCSAPGAPLKKALVEAGIGKDVYSEYENGIMQPFFAIFAKDTDIEKREQFVEIIESVLCKQAAGELNHTSLRAALNIFEFKYREADFGSYPRGLMLGLQMFDSWLYADDMPFLHIVANDTYASLKNKVDTGYFENLIKTKILDNTHKLILAVTPKKGLTTIRDNELADKLAAYKASLSDAEIQGLVDATRELKEYQEAEDDAQSLAKIPLLTRADLKKEATPFINDERSIDGIPALYHDIFTNGIAYIRFIFNTRNIPSEYWTYVGLLKSFIGLMDTTNYEYGDMFNEMNLKTGGIAPLTNIYPNIQESGKYEITFEVKAKALYENIPDVFNLVSEMLLNTQFDNGARLLELIQETLSHVQGSMMSSGHHLAVAAGMATISEAEATISAMNGIPFLRMLENLEKDFDTNKDTIVTRMNELVNMIFRPENLMLDYVGSAESYEKFAALVPGFKQSLKTDTLTLAGGKVSPVKEKKAYSSAAQVQFVGRCGDYAGKGLKYDGSLRALKVMLEYDYLWTQVRVKGGAYGCMAAFSPTGKSYFVSYRDPHLMHTVEIYNQAAEYVRKFDADERTMAQYIIGAVAGLDVPMTPATRGLYGLKQYMTGTTMEMIQKERDELLATTPDKIRSMAVYIDAFMDTDAFCVVGGEEKVKAAADAFDVIEPLFN